MYLVAPSRGFSFLLSIQKENFEQILEKRRKEQLEASEKDKYER